MNYLSDSKRKSTNKEEELPSIIPSQLVSCEGAKLSLFTLQVVRYALGRAQMLEDPMTEGKWKIIKRDRGIHKPQVLLGESPSCKD